MSPLPESKLPSVTIPAPPPVSQVAELGQWPVEDAIETWPESEPPEAPTVAPPPHIELPDELPPDSDDFRDTIPSPPPPGPLPTIK